MKDISNVIKEYGYVLLWFNNYTDESGNFYPRYFFLSNPKTHEKIVVKNKDALKYIEEQNTEAFRTDTDVYNNYVELFRILGIKTK